MRIAAATALAAAAAVAANLVLRALAVALFDIPQPEFEPLNVRPVILSTVGGVVAAGIVRALLSARTFLIVAGVALVLSLAAPLTIDDPDADAAAVGTLIAMHLVAAAISVALLLRVSRGRRRARWRRR